MKTSVTVTIGLLFVVVSGFFYFLAPQPEPLVTGKAAPVSMKLLPLEDQGPINFIQIQNVQSGETINLERKDGRWTIRHPIVCPAETMIVEGLVTALKLSTRARRLNPEKPWSEYGLAKPLLKVGVQTEYNSTRRYLYFGDASPVGRFVFARWEGEKDYFLVNEDLKSAFSRSLYSLRSKQLFRTPVQRIVKIRVRSGANEYEVERRGSKWFWLEPIPILGQVVSKRQIDDINGQLGELFVKEFIDDGKKTRADYGFTLLSPWLKVWDNEGKEEIFRVGQEIPDKDSFVLMREGDSSFFLVARSNISAFLQKFEAMAQETAANGG